MSGELWRFLESKRKEHTRGAPYHPMTQGKIERYHRSMKSLIQLQNYTRFPGTWSEIARFVDYLDCPPGRLQPPAVPSSSLDNVNASGPSTSGEPRRV